MKSLVVYYSHKGSTKFVVEQLAKKLDCEIEELVPEKRIPQKGPMMYLKGGFGAKTRTTPKISEPKHNPNDFDMVIFASPVWAGTYVQYFNSYFNTHKVENKKVALIATFDGGVGNTFKDFEKHMENNDITDTLELKGILRSEDRSEYEKQINAWAEKLNE